MSDYENPILVKLHSKTIKNKKEYEEAFFKEFCGLKNIIWEVLFNSEDLRNRVSNLLPQLILSKDINEVNSINVESIVNADFKLYLFNEMVKATQDTLVKKHYNKMCKLRSDFICFNSGLVLIVVNKIRHSDKDDLFQSGIMGLYEAVNRFRPELGFRFSTYSKFWIDHYIKRFLDCCSETIRKPVHVKAWLRQTYRSSKSLDDNLEESEFRHDTIQGIKACLGNAISLNEKYRDSEDEKIENITYALENSLDEEFCNSEIIKLIVDIIKNILKVKVNSRDYDIFCLRYGINGGDCHSLNSLGKKYSMSRERARQIAEKCLCIVREALIIKYPDIVKLYN